MCAEEQAHGLLVRERTRCKEWGVGDGGGVNSSDESEVDAGRDHTTPASVRHDEDQPLRGERVIKSWRNLTPCK
jgi:hypothetical protein